MRGIVPWEIWSASRRSDSVSVHSSVISTRSWDNEYVFLKQPRLLTSKDCRSPVLFSPPSPKGLSPVSRTARIFHLYKIQQWWPARFGEQAETTIAANLEIPTVTPDLLSCQDYSSLEDAYHCEDSTWCHLPWPRAWMSNEVNSHIWSLGGRMSRMPDWIELVRLHSRPKLSTMSVC